MPWPWKSRSSSCCSPGGGGSFDHALQYRPSITHGSAPASGYPALTFLSASGHDTPGRLCSCSSLIFPPARHLFDDRLAAALVPPAEAEGTADKYPVATDGNIASHLILAPPERVLRLLVALLHPGPEPVQPHDLDKVCRL